MKKNFIIMALLAMLAILIPACSKDDDNKVNEEGKTPKASFTMSNDSIFVNDTVYFTNTSTDAASYLWDFGDENTTIEISPNHSYNNAGDYNVTLTAYSPDGTKHDMKTETIEVKELPVANFTYSPTTVYVNEVVTFTNMSTNAGSYLWDFGDNSLTSTDFEPTHTYTAVGDYRVTLIAYSVDRTKSYQITNDIQVDSHSGSNFTITVNGVSFEMIYVKGGTFMMGEEGVSEPVHEVTLTDDYYIGKFEVTQALWQAVMGSNPSYFKDPERPVESLAWNDIVYKFLPALNKLTGRTFVLPTEAQWEFAARGGVNSQSYTYSGSNNVDEVAWYGDNSAVEGTIQSHPVGQKQANELGIYDMSGNIFEWCSDWFEEYSSEPQTNPTGPTTGHCRVLRGGSWFHGEWLSRVTFRGICSGGGNAFGFRLALIP